MKYFLYILLAVILVSCTTSNTMYKEPKGLIPKDSMITLLTDMYIASSAKNVKNKFLKREKSYAFLVYDKYKIDSTRFDISNTYYISKIEEYTEMLEKVKSNIDSIQSIYIEESRIKDSLDGKKRKKIDDKGLLEEIPRELLEKNTKLLSTKKKSLLEEKIINGSSKTKKKKTLKLEEYKKQ